MTRTLRFLLLTVLTMVCGNMFAEATPVTLKWNVSGSTALPTALGNDIAFTWEKGTGSKAPRTDGYDLYFYNGNRVTIAGTSDAITITKIVFTLGSDGPASMRTCNASGLEESTVGITVTESPRATTWEGETKSIIFRGNSSDTKTRYIKKIEVTYTNGGSTPFVKVPELNITQDNIADTYDMDANSVFVVYCENKGTAAAENTKLTLYVDGAENASKTIGTLENGNSDIWNAKYDVTKFEAGEHTVKLSLTADNAEAVNIEKTVTFTKKAPEATFTVSAQNVNVAYDATSYQVVAKVKNTSETVAATGVQVMLQRNVQNVVDPQTVNLAAGEEKDVTFTVNAPEGGFTAGSLNYWVVVKAYEKTMALQEIAVTVAEAPVQEVKDLAITAVDGTIDLANSTNNVRVIVQNKGNVDITDAPVTLKTGEKVLGTATVSAKAGQQGFCYITVASEGLEAGNLDVTAIVEFDESKTAKLDATLTVKAAPVPTAKFNLTAQDVETKVGEETFTVKVTVKNVGDAAGAAEVKLLNGMNKLGEAQTTNALEVNAEQVLTFTVANPFTAEGEYNLQAMTTDNMYGCYVKVTVAPADEEKFVDIALIDIRGLEEINLKNETNAVQVWFTNNSTVDELNATITLKMNGTEVATEAIAKGESYKSFTLPTANLVAGGQAALAATLNVENNKEGNLAEVTKTLNIVSGEATPSPAFTVTAEKVEVLTTDTKVKVVVNVKNTGNEKAAQTEVKLIQGTTQIGESKWIYGLEAEAEQNVTFEIDNFDKAGTYQMQAWVTCGEIEAAAYFDIVVKAPVANLAVEAIQGTIDLAATTSNITVTVKNIGTADVKDAAVTLTAGEQTLGTATVSVKAGETGYAFVAVATEGLTAGELDVTAKVEYDENKTAQLAGKLTVKAAEAPQATFSVEAENVTVPFGAESFTIAATIKNTSEVNANGLTVKLLEGITEVETRMLDIVLQADQSTTETFTITASEDKPFVAGKTVLYYVQAGNAQKEVSVTFAKETQAEVKDVTIESIQGTIDLSAEQSNITVTVKNNGNVDVKDTKVTLSYGETTLEKAVSAKAGEQGYAFFQIASEGIEGETLNVTATVVLEGDATPADNTKTENLTVKAVAPDEPTFSVTAADVTVPFGATQFEIKATVKNTSEVAANGLTVKLLKGINPVDEKALDIILAAGNETEVAFNVNEIGEAGTTAKYYVQVENKTQAEVTVTFAQEAETPFVDMTLTQIQGVTEINLKEENKVMVWYKNEGNVATTATVNATLNGTALEAQTVENIKAEGQGYVTFTLPVEGLTAGQTATFVATIAAENDANADNNSISKELTVVSGEEVPQAEIMINPIRGWNVEAGEQEISLTVSVFNQGDADAKDVTVQLYKDYPTILAEQTVDVKAGAEGNYKMFTMKFTYTFEQGKDYEFTVFTNFKDNNGEDNMRTFTLSCPAPKAEIAIAKIATVQATNEDEVKIAATLSNTSDVEAKNVKVGIYKVENTEYTLVGIMQAVETIAAGAEANVEFNLGKLEAGNYTYYVRVVSINGVAATTTRDVDVNVTEYVAPVVEVALTAIQGISNIDLANDTINTISVWAENKGNVDANATFGVKLNDTTLEAQTVTVKAGKNGYAMFTLPIAGLKAGEKATLVATVTVEGNTSETTTLTREYDVVNSSVATEPVFEITAQPVEVEFGAKKFDVVATVKNASAIAAKDVEVKLFHNQTIDSLTIDNLAAEGETVVTFKDVKNPFTKAGSYTMYVMAPKATAEVNITVKPEPETPVVEVALTAIQGISNIDLANDTINTISVWAENKGNVDATATFSVKLNDTALEAQTVEMKAGKNGYATFTLPIAGLKAGEKATVVATVTVADNTSETTTMTREYDVVNSNVATEPVLAITAQPVEVEFDAEKFNVVATVKNTSTIDAKNVEVKLFYNQTIDSLAIASLAAGTETTLTFENVQNPFSKAGSYTMYVIATKAMAEVNVTVKPEPVEEKVDLAITAIQGNLSVDNDTNMVYVWVENLGNVDVKNADVSIDYTNADGNLAGKGAVVSIKAGEQKYVAFEILGSELTVGEFKLIAKVKVLDDNLLTIDVDVDKTNNEMEKTYTVAAPEAKLSFEALTLKNDNGYTVRIRVTNSSNVAANDVAVVIYNEDIEKIGETTIATVAGNATETVEFAIDGSYEGKNIQVYVATLETKWIRVVEQTDGINSIMAKNGKDIKIFTIDGKKAEKIRKGGLYIINGKRVVVK